MEIKHYLSALIIIIIGLSLLILTNNLATGRESFTENIDLSEGEFENTSFDGQSLIIDPPKKQGKYVSKPFLTNTYAELEGIQGIIDKIQENQLIETELQKFNDEDELINSEKFVFENESKSDFELDEIWEVEASDYLKFELVMER